jgi:hypothetical protein
MLPDKPDKLSGKKPVIPDSVRDRPLIFRLAQMNV